MQFQSAPGIDVIAPGLLQQEWREAEAFGAATWLWMQAATRRDTPVSWLSTLLLPPIAQRQFLIATEAGRPVFYVSWANFSETAEHHYVNGPRAAMVADDWISGDRMWIIDWIAPFGHTRMMHALLMKQLLASRCMRSLYHRGAERGVRIKSFRGNAVNPAEARAWFASHPVVIGPDIVDGLSDAFHSTSGSAT
jgi:cytolysin-activating lysine-acyltransferase